MGFRLSEGLKSIFKRRATMEELGFDRKILAETFREVTAINAMTDEEFLQYRMNRINEKYDAIQQSNPPQKPF